MAVMYGMPWELGQLPLGLHSNPVGDVLGQPSQRKTRTRKGMDPSKLDTITERPTGSSGLFNSGLGSAVAAYPGSGLARGVNTPGVRNVYQQQDACTSTTDLCGSTSQGGAGMADGPVGDGSHVGGSGGASVAGNGSENVNANRDGGGPKKVQKGQIHTLAKILSTLRR